MKHGMIATCVNCMSVPYNFRCMNHGMTATDGELYVCTLQWPGYMNHSMTTTGGELYVCTLQILHYLN